MRWLVPVLLLAGCKAGTHTTDTSSSGIKSRELRIAFLKDYLPSPSEPLDVEFHVVVHDNSQGLLAGPSDSSFQAAVRVKPSDVPKWAMGCQAIQLDVRPPWVEPMLKGKKGWDVTEQPDTYRCGREARVIHVHEGVIFRQVSTEAN